MSRIAIVGPVTEVARYIRVDLSDIVDAPSAQHNAEVIDTLAHAEAVVKHQMAMATLELAARLPGGQPRFMEDIIIGGRALEVAAEAHSALQGIRLSLGVRV